LSITRSNGLSVVSALDARVRVVARRLERFARLPSIAPRRSFARGARRRASAPSFASACDRVAAAARRRRSHRARAAAAARGAGATTRDIARMTAALRGVGGRARRRTSRGVECRVSAFVFGFSAVEGFDRVAATRRVAYNEGLQRAGRVRSAI